MLQATGSSSACLTMVIRTSETSSLMKFMLIFLQSPSSPYALYTFMRVLTFGGQYRGMYLIVYVSHNALLNQFHSPSWCRPMTSNGTTCESWLHFALLSPNHKCTGSMQMLLLAMCTQAGKVVTSFYSPPPPPPSQSHSLLFDPTLLPRGLGTTFIVLHNSLQSSCHVQ